MSAFFRTILLTVFIFIGESAHADFTKCLPEKLKNSSTYEMVPMIPGYRSSDRNNNVHYYSKEEAENEFLLEFQNGKAVIDSGQGLHPWTSVRNIYVMDQSEKIYVLSANPFLQQNHSSILAGDDVAGAGNIVFKNGNLSFIDNGSGHYKPEKWILRQILATLLKKGVDISEASIGFGGNKMIQSKVSSFNALQFLFQSSESRRCIDQLMKDATQVTAKELKEYRALDQNRFSQFVNDLKRKGRLDEYSVAIDAITKEDVRFESYFNQPLPKSCFGLMLSNLFSKF